MFKIKVTKKYEAKTNHYFFHKDSYYKFLSINKDSEAAILGYEYENHITSKDLTSTTSQVLKEIEEIDNFPLLQWAKYMATGDYREVLEDEYNKISVELRKYKI